MRIMRCIFQYVVITSSGTNGSTNYGTRSIHCAKLRANSKSYWREKPVSRKVSWSEPTSDKHNFKKRKKKTGIRQQASTSIKMASLPNARAHELLADDFPRRVRFAEWFNVRNQRKNFLDWVLIGDCRGKKSSFASIIFLFPSLGKQEGTCIVRKLCFLGL